MSAALGVPVALALILAAWTLPRWLPPAVVALREWIFARVNGAEGIPVPGPLVPPEEFERVYSDPAADGRSRGRRPVRPVLVLARARPADAPGASGARPALRRRSPGPRARCSPCRTPARAELAAAATRRGARRAAGRPDHRHVRLRDLMMPVWAEVYYELVFGEPCPPDGPRADRRRTRTTWSARSRAPACGTWTAATGSPGTCAAGSRPGPARSRCRRRSRAEETAWYLQGAFFNTAVVQMSEAMAHLLLAIAPTQTSRGAAVRTGRRRGAGPGDRRGAAGASALRRRAPDHLGRHRLPTRRSRPDRCCCSTTWPSSAPGRRRRRLRPRPLANCPGRRTSSRSASPRTGPARPGARRR